MAERRRLKRYAVISDAFGLDDCVVHIGSRLGYEDECIINTLPAEYDGGAADPAAMLIENPNNNSFIGKHLSDDEFIRGGVPMTKSEIRALSIAALDAEPNSIVYDIGAGTGSVSIELSLRAHDITVYAIERNEEALKLISENRRKFCADNIKIVNGEAPEALSELPPPDSVFIGGSGGRLDKIIGAVIEKNRDAKIVVNAISLNTASVVIDIAERLCLDVEASLITAAHSKRAGKSMLMFGENPIYIFKLWRKNSDEY